MNTANARNSLTRTGGGAWGTPSGASATMGEDATTGPVRGYVKLRGATEAFNFDFRGKTVLDIGSSTGGFTEFALERGARKVIAVEKGTHQMKAPLRFDPRIELHEKTDIFDVKATSEGVTAVEGVPHRALRDGGGQQLAGPPLVAYPDVIVADVSFLSLTKVLKYAKMNLTRRTTEFLVMLKPQFEARPDQLNRGVVKNERMRRDIIKRFESWLTANGFIIVGKHDNDLAGRTGNKERFYHLALAKK